METTHVKIEKKNVEKKRGQVAGGEARPGIRGRSGNSHSKKRQTEKGGLLGKGGSLGSFGGKRTRVGKGRKR